MRKSKFAINAGAIAVLMLLVGHVSAQTPTNPRFGKWKLKSDNPAPWSNVMTYEPHNGTGMKITIDAVDTKGVKSQWGYTTMFDGKDEKLYGNPSTDTGSVKVITDRINEIVYKKGGKVTQVLTNVLSPDGQKIGVMYMRMDESGNTSNVTFATYERMP